MVSVVLNDVLVNTPNERQIAKWDNVMQGASFNEGRFYLIWLRDIELWNSGWEWLA